MIAACIIDEQATSEERMNRKLQQISFMNELRNC